MDLRHTMPWRLSAELLAREFNRYQKPRADSIMGAFKDSSNFFETPSGLIGAGIVVLALLGLLAIVRMKPPPNE